MEERKAGKGGKEGNGAEKTPPKINFWLHFVMCCFLYTTAAQRSCQATLGTYLCTKIETRDINILYMFCFFILRG